MADYWVSNDRKYCDFCKCWIADNKPSIAFHEGGKKHKRNVAKRITEISIQSAKDEKAKQKADQQFRQMEDAAMRAYSLDISQASDMTSRAINAINGSTFQGPTVPSAPPETIRTNGTRPGPAALPRRAIDPMLPPIDILEEEEREKRERMKRKNDGNAGGSHSAEAGTSGVADNSLWCEAISDEGHTYYWNVKTGASIWTAPKEGYMTLEEYNRINKIAESQQEVRMLQESKFMRDNADEIVAKYKREKLKTFRAKPSKEEVKQKEEEQANYKEFEEPGWNAQPFGQWQTVPETNRDSYADLQLPIIQQDIPYYVPAADIPPEPPVKKFKEKTITTLDTEHGTVSDSFKKRKPIVKRNARQRLDDD